jgi:predicted nuclease of predicted toxin-antitoxin system
MSAVIWVDAQLSPALAPWIEATFGVEARSVGWLGLRHATDAQIFQAARDADAVVLTKDADFMRLLTLHGPPPRVVWLTFGNTTNSHVRAVLMRTFPAALAHLASGEGLIEIRAV